MTNKSPAIARAQSAEVGHLTFPEYTNLEAFSYYARLGRVRDYLDLHISEELPLQKASQIAGLEVKYFSSFFHAKTGLRYKDWIRYVRIGRAIEMIALGIIP